MIELSVRQSAPREKSRRSAMVNVVFRLHLRLNSKKFLGSVLSFGLRCRQSGIFLMPARKQRSTDLDIFHGHHCYISPDYDGKPGNVPTWNYISIQVGAKQGRG